METTNYYPVFSFKFLRALVIHMRPYLLFVSGAAGLAGMALGWQNENTLFNFILIFLPFFLGYGFGQALTDCFQIDTDTISAPYRPLVKKEISTKALGIVSLSCLVLIGIPVIYYNSLNIIFCVLSIFGLATYTYFKKNFWMAGPFYNGWIVMLLPIMGILAVSQQNLNFLLNKDILLVCIITFFSYANFVLIGYLKDITADRQTRYRTFSAVFGWDKSVWLADLFLIIVLISGVFLLETKNLMSFGTFLLASFIAVAGQVKAHITKIKTEEYASFPIASTVRAFILWHISIVLYFQPAWLLFVVLFYGAFELVLFFRPERNQI